MPRGVYTRTKKIIFSEEAKKHISEAHKGLIPWNKGKKCPQLCVKKKSGWHHSENTKKIISENLKNKKIKRVKTKEQIEKHRLKMIGIKMPPRSAEHLRKLSGENASNWQGGKSFENYPINWSNNLRISIRERDKYLCRICNKKEDIKKHDVHHIDYNKKNCNPDNLITLCKSCHSKTNNKRLYWIKYFKNL